MNEVSTTSISPLLLAFRNFVVPLAEMVRAFNRGVVAWARDMDRQYERRVRLNALRERHRWKVSDVARLRTYPNLRISPRRLERLRTSGKRGRPVVQPFVPLLHALKVWFAQSKALFDADTLPHIRLKALKNSRYWPEFAEALYRGCLAEVRTEGLLGASAKAEARAADVLLVSTASLRSLRTHVRRVHDSGLESMPPLSRDEFRCWLRTGVLPDRGVARTRRRRRSGVRRTRSTLRRLSMRAATPVEGSEGTH
jgi:hypothetical protein